MQPALLFHLLHGRAPKAHVPFPTRSRATKPALRCQSDSQFRTAGAMGSFKHTGGKKACDSPASSRTENGNLSNHTALNTAKPGGAWPDSPCTLQAGGASWRNAAALEALDRRRSARKSQNQREALDAPVPLPNAQGPVRSRTKNSAGLAHRQPLPLLSGTPGIRSKCHTFYQGRARELQLGHETFPTC